MNAVTQRPETTGGRGRTALKLLSACALMVVCNQGVFAAAQVTHSQSKQLPPASSSATRIEKGNSNGWQDAARTLFGAPPQSGPSPAAQLIQQAPTNKPAPSTPLAPMISLASGMMPRQEPPLPNAAISPSAAQPLESKTVMRNAMPASVVRSINEIPDPPRELMETVVEPNGPPPTDNSVLAAMQDLSAAWWSGMVRESMFTTASEKITPDYLVYQALQNSPFIRAISRDPLIREQEVTEANAEFDPELFAKTLYDDRVDPVGNTLETSEPFLKQNIWTGQAGVRRKLQTGADVEIGQKLGFENSNGRFFSPQDQGTATISINVNQPLLRGGGRLYNRSQIMLAQATQQAGWQTFLIGFQDELIKIGESYWNLNYRRGVLLQKQRNVKRGADVLAKLQGRADLDSVPSQILRAQAAVASRETELSNSLRDIENAQTEIRRLIGDRAGLSTYDVEMIPAEAPSYVYESRPFDQLVQQAIENRSEIREAVQRAKIAAIESDIGRNEMLPELNLILRSYMSALEGDSGIEYAWQQQWVSTAPGYAAGLEYAIPYGRRASKSRLTQRQLKLQKVNEEIDVVILAVVSETQVAARHIDSAFKTMQAAAGAIHAATADLEYQYQRWEGFALVEGDFSEGQTPVTLLDQLLDAQQRLSNSEAIYSQSEFEFKKAQLALNRATGTILQHERIEFSSACNDGLPSLQIDQHSR